MFWKLHVLKLCWNCGDCWVSLCLSLCVCRVVLCLQPHVYGHAWRPEDEQPHSDQHHAGCLPGRSQDQGGVPDALTEGLKDSAYRARVHTHSCAQATNPQPHFKQKSTNKPLAADTGSCCLHQGAGDWESRLSSRHLRLMNFSLANQHNKRYKTRSLGAFVRRVMNLLRLILHLHVKLCCCYCEKLSLPVISLFKCNLCWVLFKCLIPLCFSILLFVQKKLRQILFFVFLFVIREVWVRQYAFFL